MGRALPRNARPAPGHGAPPEYRKTGWQHPCRNAGSAAASPRPRMPDCSKDREMTRLWSGPPDIPADNDRLAASARRVGASRFRHAGCATAILLSSSHSNPAVELQPRISYVASIDDAAVITSRPVARIDPILMIFAS